MSLSIRCVLFVMLGLAASNAAGCKGCTTLDASDFARMISSGEVAAGKRMPEAAGRMGHYHWGWEEADSHIGTQEDRFDTYIARDRRRVITIYAHNEVAFAACTIAEQRFDIQYPPPTVTWHFFDSDLMKRYVETCQKDQRKAEAARREYLRYHGRESETLWP